MVEGLCNLNERPFENAFAKEFLKLLERNLVLTHQFIPNFRMNYLARLLCVLRDTFSHQEFDHDSQRKLPYLVYILMQLELQMSFG